MGRRAKAPPPKPKAAGVPAPAAQRTLVDMCNPEVRALLDAEVYMRDGRQDEPGRIPCPSVHKTLERLMKEPLNLT